MGIIDYVDEYLLELTTKFVKWFNWLTGKDNFWLAKIAALISPIAYGVMTKSILASILMLPAVLPLFLFISVTKYRKTKTHLLE